ncbi:MAG: hypothetical protein BWY99_01667 [Synergistetes bacterium ADurb.BinA166]|nr:MAG: hypothetical protein BWY99_01667 [Synergistetes bacterium ADurb.BinA166]
MRRPGEVRRALEEAERAFVRPERRDSSSDPDALDWAVLGLAVVAAIFTALHGF